MARSPYARVSDVQDGFREVAEKVNRLTSTPGPRGPSVELQASGGFVQWRPEGGADWISLIPLSDLAGASGREAELRSSPTHIQWRLQGDAAWVDLVALADLMGRDGRELEMRANATHIQQRYVGTAGWTDVVALDDLRGGAGWTMVPAIVNDGARRVQQVADWIGGTGAKPATGQFVGPAGFVATAAEASDLAVPVPVKSTGAKLRAGTDDADFLTAKTVTDAAALVALTDAATIAVDMATGVNFTVTLAGNRTLGAPANAKPGTSGTILIKQDAAGSRTLAYHAAWMPFGAVPALSTAANAVDLLTWFAETSAKVRFTLQKGGAA